MQPPPGTYRLTTDGTPTSPPTTVTYTVTPEGIPTTFGLLTWTENPPPGMYRKGEIGLRFLSSDPPVFVAVNGSESYSGTYTAL
jgi:hypothetical protein